MELFSLLAKLTLDSKEYEKGITTAERKAKGMKIPEPHLGLDDKEFVTGISNANSAKVSDLEDPTLGLDDDEFTTGIDNANDAEVNNPPEPLLGLNDEAFTTGIDDANTATVSDPAEPTLSLDDSEFTKGIDSANEATVADPAEPVLGIDDSTFTAGIDDANAAEVNDPTEPYLGIDDSDFTSGIDDANDAEVSDPDTPSLDLDTTGFDDAIQTVETDSNLFSSSLKEIFSGLSGLLVTTGIVGAVTGVVNSLKEGIDMVKNTGDTIHKQSAFLGLTTKAYQELDYALQLSGTSITEFSRSMKSFQQMAGGDITKDQAEAFEKLGIKAEEAADSQDLMYKSLYALADYTGTDRDIIAKALFGNNYNKLDRLLESGSQGIKEMQEEAEGLGLVMTDEEIQNAADYMDATTRLEKAMDGLKQSFVADIIPLLTEAANKIAAIVAFFNPRTQKNSLSEQFAEDDKAFSEELATIEGTSAAAETLADKLLQMGDTSKMTAEQYAIWKGTAEELINLVPTLGEVIDTESGKISANSDQIKENIKQWENLAKQKALQTLKEKKYQEIVEKNEELISKTIEANKKAADAESARRIAAEKFSNKMQEYGLGSLDMNGNIDQQIRDVMSRLAEGGDQYESELLGLGVALKEFGEATTEAGKAQADAERLSEELEKGKKEYEDWVEAAEKLYGGLEDDAASAISQVNELAVALRDLPGSVTVGVQYDNRGYTHAIGASYIPFDNYPALLHRGEKVLTATEARQESQSVDYSALEDRIVAAIYKGMENAQVTAVVTDRQVAKGSNRYNGNELDARRFMP